MSTARTTRRIMSGMLAVGLVAASVYAAAALLTPVPAWTLEQTIDVPDAEGVAAQLALPTAGSTAVVVGSAPPVLAGSAAARPIAGAAKLVLVNVVLDAEPLELGQPGTALSIDQSHVARYRELNAAGARTVPVTFGETWTRRDLLQATLLASGNNTAELLIDEVFGGLPQYLEAASAWLSELGLDDTVVADGSGLDADSRSTALDLARLTAMTLANPVLADLVERRPLDTSAGVRLVDEASFVPSTGALGLVRSYTDAAGVCIVLAVPVGDRLAAGVVLGQPGYPSAEDAVRALVDSLSSTAQAVEVVSAGQRVAVVSTDWGQEVALLADAAVSVDLWSLESTELQVRVPPRSTVIAGTDVGSLTVISDPLDGGTEQVVRVRADGTITEPGVAWRFADPVTVLQRWTG